MASFLHFHVSNASSTALNEYAKRITGPEASDYLVSSYEEALEIMTTQPGFFFYGETMIMEQVISATNTIDINLNSFPSLNKLEAHLIFARDSPYARMISLGIIKLKQAGIMDQIIDNYKPRVRGSGLNGNRSLNLTDLQFGFAAYLAVICIVFAVLICERCTQKLKQIDK